MSASIFVHANNTFWCYKCGWVFVCLFYFLPTCPRSMPLLSIQCMARWPQWGLTDASVSGIRMLAQSWKPLNSLISQSQLAASTTTAISLPTALAMIGLRYGLSTNITVVAMLLAWGCYVFRRACVNLVKLDIGWNQNGSLFDLLWKPLFQASCSVLHRE